MPASAVTGIGSPGEQSHVKPSLHLLGVLAGLMGVSPLFMLTLSSTSAAVVERFEITAGQLGLVATLVFGSAAVAARPLGRWTDVVSLRWQLLLNFGGVALSLLVAALTTSYLLICVVAVLAGASQAISIPPPTGCCSKRFLRRSGPAG